MRTVQSQEQIPLSAVKPLEGLLKYRQHCVDATRKALDAGSTNRRTRSLVADAALEPAGDVEGLAYGRCPKTGSLFLLNMPAPAAWKRLLTDVSAFRRSRDTFHSELAQSRTDNVYAPKLEWIRETLRLQGMRQPQMMEAFTEPSAFTALLKDSGLCAQVVPVDEMDLAHGTGSASHAPVVDAAVMLESFDRVDDPVALLRGVVGRLKSGGLIFVTALVSSGFDMAILGLN